MHFLKKLLDFYINSSVHVALSVFALVKMTQFLFPISNDNAVAYFAFFGTIVGYNFVKYDALARTQKAQMRSQLKGIVVLSSVALIATGYYFFKLQLVTQSIAVAFLLLTMLYTLPFFPNKSNARNWAGIKIYVVTLCWVGVTLLLPIINSGMPLNIAVLLVALQRFILVFVLMRLALATSRIPSLSTSWSLASRQLHFLGQSCMMLSRPFDTDISAVGPQFRVSAGWRGFPGCQSEFDPFAEIYRILIGPSLARRSSTNPMA